MTASNRPAPLAAWQAELAAWAIPEEILASVPDSPWELPVGLFRSRADEARTRTPPPSGRGAAGCLPAGGTVLDVGPGGGAASLPLAGKAARLVAVDESAGMLA